VATSSEVRTLKEITDIKQIENLASAVQAHHVETNLDALIHFHSTRIPHSNSHDWYTPMIISFGTVTLLHVMYHFSHSCIRKILRRFKMKETPETIVDSPVPDLQQAAVNTEPEGQLVEATPQISFVKNPLPMA
jgi:hypothetical protein